MKIKNFPPFVLDKQRKNYDPHIFSLNALRRAVSIDDIFDDKMKSKEEFEEIKKKTKNESQTNESQNLITSNFL